MATEVLELTVKSNIGELSKDTQAIIEAIKDAKKETKELSTETEGVGKSSEKSVSGVKKLTGAFGGLMKSLGIVAIVASVFTTLKEALERNQKVMDTVNAIMGTISTTFNQLANVLVEVINWTTKSTDRFDGLGKTLSGLVTLALTPLKVAFFGLKLGVQEVQLAWEKWVGAADPKKIAELKKGIDETTDSLAEIAKEAVNAGADIYNNIGDAIGEIGDIYEKASEGISKISIKANYEQAKATTAATKAALFAAAEFAKLNAEKLKEAELFRQIRDDETKTFAERIQANKDLKKSLEEQQKLQSEQIQKQVTAAALAVKQNGNDENKLALMEAQNAQLELEETITGQLSEQKTNQVSLEKELAEIKKEITTAALEGITLELEELKNSYEMQLEMARKAGEDITALDEKYAKDKKAILEAAAKNEEDILDAADQKEKDRKKALQSFNVGMAQQGLQVIADAAGEGTALAKAAAIAQATISGVQGVQNAFTSANANIGATAGTFGAYPVTMAALAGVFAAANIAKIASGSPASASGGGGGGGATAAATTPAPQMMSGAFELGGGVKPEPMKAFVVTDEMSNSQSQLANIRRRATI
jgi:hypothetical protein